MNGSNEAAIEMAMRSAAKRLQDVSVPVRMHAEGDTLVIGIGAAPDNSDKRSATIWLAIAKAEATVSITRGENSGKTLSYYHPVKELTPIGVWQGDAMTLRLPLKDLKSHGGRLPGGVAPGGECRADPRRRAIRSPLGAADPANPAF